MDTLTHVALGACLGEVFAGKIIGRRAILWGVVAHSLPDIDFLASFWLDISSNLLAHRGFTHSILFCLLAAYLLSLIADRTYRRLNYGVTNWLVFFAVALFVHIFIDGFNNYGVGWLEPFSGNRYAFNTIYVADPFFSVFPGIATIVLLVRRTGRRALWGRAALGFSGIYLVYCITNKIRINDELKDRLDSQHISYTRYLTTPAPLQNWLWYIVVEDSSGFHVGFHSLLANKKQLTLEYFPKNYFMARHVDDHIELNRLIRFSQGFYSLEQRRDTLVFNDLRFGQIAGWEYPHGKFVFQFYLSHSSDNKLVVQRGRFQGWDRNTLQSFFNKLAGN